MKLYYLHNDNNVLLALPTATTLKLKTKTKTSEVSSNQASRKQNDLPFIYALFFSLFQSNL